MDQVKLLIVDEHPRLGESGRILDSVMSTVLGVDPNDYTMFNFLPVSDKPSKKELEERFKALCDFVAVHKPKAIVGLGEVVLNSLCGQKKITKWRGTVQTLKVGSLSVPVVPTYSPNYIHNQQTHLGNWANDINKAYNISQDIVETVSPTQAVLVDTREKVLELIGYCQQTGFCCFDFETVEIEKKKATFHPEFYATMLSISFQAGSGYVIPLQHKQSPFSMEDIDWIMNQLRFGVFENPDVRKIAHNLNFDHHVLRRYGLTKLRGRIDDTMLMHHLHDETERAGLKVLVTMYFYEYSGYETELEGYVWEDIPLKKLAQYAATDTDMTIRLCTLLESYLMQDERSYVIYRNLTMAAYRPLWEAEARGMQIDREFLRAAIKEVKTMIQRQKIRLRKIPQVAMYEQAKREEETERVLAEQEAKLEKWLSTHKAGTKMEAKYREKIRAIKTGEEVVYSGLLFSSWQQLQDLLYDHEYGFRFISIDKGTGADILKELPDTSGFTEHLITLRSLEKTLSTYLLGIQDRLDDNDRIHTNFKLNGTASGRLSSANPNLQNIPNTSKLSNEDLIHAVGLVKKSFTVPEGYTLVQVDYSQAELRIIASFAREENMLEVYQGDGDIHSKTAAGMIGVDIDDFDKSIPEHGAARQKAKAVNFGFIYGMSAAGFQVYAKTDYGIEMTYEEAEKTRNIFFNTYPKLLDYHDIYVAKGRKFEHVRTLFGRRRHLKDINGMDETRAAMDERVAINSPIQGTAGEFTIFGIALLYFRLDPRVHFVNTVHDSILLYIPDDILDSTLKTVANCCENLPVKQYFGKELYGVGMKVDMEGSKENWKSLQEIK